MIKQIKRSMWAMLITLMVLGVAMPSAAHAGSEWGYTKKATASVSVTPATCDSGAKLVYGPIVGAVYSSGVQNGAIGPVDSSVTFKALKGYSFQDYKSTLTIAVILSGPDTALCPPALKTATAMVNVIAATCTSGAKISFSGVLYATASGSADGTTGPGSYNVTFTADEGAQFDAKGTKTLEFNGTLAGPLTGVVCNPGSGSTQTPSAPAPVAVQSIKALPYTAGSDSTAVVAGGGLLTTLLGLVGVRRLFGRAL